MRYPQIPDPGTLGAERIVVLASRTLQALARLHYDLAPLLAIDHRIRLLYTLHGDSVRRSAAELSAIRVGIPLMAWEAVRRSGPHLVVSASAGPDLYELDAPVALLPHGATYSRVLKGLSGASGTAPEHLIGPNGEIPAFMAMPGSAAIDQLAMDCPSVLPVADITGDLCMERLRLSASMYRTYRNALGVEPHRTLVLVSSTWGPHSLTAGDRSLPQRLLTELPADEFAIAYVPHPNIDADHGGNLFPHLRSSLRNGLIMVPPEEGWRATLIAADCVIGDSGSVTFYAANLGKPVLLAAFGFDEMASGTPQEAFGAASQWLMPERDPASQIRSVITSATGSGPTTLNQPGYLKTAWAEPDPGPAWRILDHLYSLIDLPPINAAPALLPLPERIPDSVPMTAWHCDISSADGFLTWTRMPAFHPRSTVGHLVTNALCLDPVLRSAAQVVLRHDILGSRDDPDTLAHELFTTHPACSLVAIRTGRRKGLAVFDDGRRYRFRCPEHLFPVVPSALYVLGPEATMWARFASRSEFVELAKEN